MIQIDEKHRNVNKGKIAQSGHDVSNVYINSITILPRHQVRPKEYYM
jgi:hypothetical protein